MSDAAPAHPDAAAVRLARVVKRFGDVVAVDGVDLDVRSGEFFSIGGGRVAKVFLAETQGWTETDSEKHTPEAIRDNFEQIRDEAGYVVPASFEEEMGLVVQAIS